MPMPLPYHPALGQRLRATADAADRPCWLRLEGGRRELFGMAPSAGLILTNQPISPTSESNLSYVSHWHDFWTSLSSLLANAPVSPTSTDSRYQGGVMGFIGYGKGPGTHSHFPMAWMGTYPWFIHIDHDAKAAIFVTPEAGSPHANIPTSWHHLLKTVNSITQSGDDGRDGFRLTSPFRPLTSRERYGQCFDRIQAYLHSGDCYQVNFTQAFKATSKGPGHAAMDRLLATSNASHAAWVALPEGEVMSLSPELFLRVENGEITTRPIKGTAPRGMTTASDELLRRDLESSAKNQAENLMIVDLLRHDIGQHADIGTVKVQRLFEVESLPQVHHLVSTITARLHPGASAVDLVRDCFPGGSITGAPKKRAMEIIDELEDTPRSVYCGSIGFIGIGGEVELNIAIRTLLREGNDIYAWAGGGIVADSECNAEYEECFHKIGALMRALEEL